MLLAVRETVDCGKTVLLLRPFPLPSNATCPGHVVECFVVTLHQGEEGGSKLAKRSLFKFVL